MQNLPSNYRLMFSAEAIATKVRELAAEISPWAARTTEEFGAEVLAVCVLRGATFFYADLLRALSCSVETSYCRAHGYSVVSNERQGSTLSLDEVSAADRAVLIVDDICESGRTLSELERTFLERRAKEVRSAVLIRRELDEHAFLPSWSGFHYPGREWFVGYGMDDRNRYSNLADIYVVSEKEW